MLMISRRQFLYGVTALSVATQLQQYSYSGEAHGTLSSKTLSEIVEVWRHWQKNESISPQEYLDSRGIYVQNRATMSDISRKDLREGRLFEVKGLVMAKTEAAAISVLAEKLVLTGV